VIIIIISLFLILLQAYLFFDDIHKEETCSMWGTRIT